MNYAMDVIAFWLELPFVNHPVEFRCSDQRSRVGMMKSELLGRLFRGEEVRRVPCPRHRGMMWCSWPGSEQTRSGSGKCCQGTGWLPNEKPTDGSEDKGACEPIPEVSQDS